MNNIDEVSPPGWGHTKSGGEKSVKVGGTAAAMKKAKAEGRMPGVKNIFSLLWSMKNKGDQPHYKPGKKGVLKKKYKKSKRSKKSKRKIKESTMNNLEQLIGESVWNTYRSMAYIVAEGKRWERVKSLGRKAGRVASAVIRTLGAGGPDTGGSEDVVGDDQAKAHVEAGLAKKAKPQGPGFAQRFVGLRRGKRTKPRGNGGSTTVRAANVYPFSPTPLNK